MNASKSPDTPLTGAQTIARLPILITALCDLLTAFAMAVPPSGIFNHQGCIAVSGTNLDGTDLQGFTETVATFTVDGEETDKVVEDSTAWADRKFYKVGVRRSGE